MHEPHYHIEETDDGRYEIREPGADTPITIIDRLEDAVAWVKQMEPAHHADVPDQSGFHSSEE